MKGTLSNLDFVTALGLYSEASPLSSHPLGQETGRSSSPALKITCCIQVELQE